MSALPPSQRIFLKKASNSSEEGEESTKLILVSTELDIFEVDLATFTLQKLCSKTVFKKAASSQSTSHH